MITKNKLIGIDIGISYLKIAVLDHDYNLIKHEYIPHKGLPIKLLKERIKNYQFDKNCVFGITGIYSGLLSKETNFKFINSIQSEIFYIKHHYPEVRDIINIGGGSLTLILLDDNGNFMNYNTNSLCAAGTGAFLDEQAARMNITYKEIEKYKIIDNPPSIATRCAVFAKSDLIHRQQEGYSIPDMWSGLCKGMAETLLQTLLKGKPITKPTAVIGGVSKNKQVLKWIKKRSNNLVFTFKNAHICSALGTAMLLKNESKLKLFNFSKIQNNEIKNNKKNLSKPLLLKKSKYPDFTVKENYIDNYNNEIRITRWESNIDIDGYLGIDIGSTSTKVILINKNSDIIIDIYRKTGGEPIKATQTILKALLETANKKNTNLKISGCGTTGSGRKMVGIILNADTITNEITSHVAGALSIDKSIDTIFEIGGQDSKYMRIKNNHISDSNMNYVCAAGTGSFIEEQVKKLDFKLDDIGDIVYGLIPPFTSDRCTVFMKQDINKILRQGYTKTEAMSAVMYSVAKNYLNKVVSKRYISKNKIFFQGATARNKGLVAAFENILNTEIVVSPYCHVMGALGVAILTKNLIEKNNLTTTFVGLDICNKKISITTETCKSCRNYCNISFANIENKKHRPSWGYMCGREPEVTIKKNNKNFDLFTLREKLFYECFKNTKPAETSTNIGIPFCLTTYTYLPLWKTFFNELNVNTVLSKKTNQDIINNGVKLSGADFCFPVKLSHGHIYDLLTKNDVDYIFSPYMISAGKDAEKDDKYTNNLFCPYVTAHTSAIKTTFKLNKFDASKLLTPVIDFRWNIKKLSKELFNYFKNILNVTYSQVSNALYKALETQKTFHNKCKYYGNQALENLKSNNQKGIIIIGRPYNTFDSGANLSLPHKIADKGYNVIPIDFIPMKTNNNDLTTNKIFWTYGQLILNAINYIKETNNIYGIYLTNFNCGPDSFLLSFAEELIGNKPFLILEMDEHGADAGYITRIEAFLDVLSNNMFLQKPINIHFPRETPDVFKNKKILFPPMHPFGAKFYAAAFRDYGYKAEVLPFETRIHYEIGRGVTRGCECLPAAITIGNFLNTIKNSSDPESHALFMPSANGPCRFGLYNLLHRIILNKEGYKNIPILSPSTENSYQGISEGLRRKLLDCTVITDILQKYECRIRPYEINKGEVNKVLKDCIDDFEKCLENGDSIEKTLIKAKNKFNNIKINSYTKPLVGIVGEIYIRANTFSNENLINHIENYGGEAWVSPVNEWLLYTAWIEKWRAKQKLSNFIKNIYSTIKNVYLFQTEHKWYKLAGSIISDRLEHPIDEVIENGKKYFPVNFQGEAILTIGRALLFAKQGASLIVNCAPFGCMPGTLSAAVFQDIQNEIKIPIVNMFYDGETDLNSKLEIFLQKN